MRRGASPRAKHLPQHAITRVNLHDVEPATETQEVATGSKASILGQRHTSQSRGSLQTSRRRMQRPHVLDDNRYGPGNRPHWALSRTRFPNLIRALNTEPDMDTRKRVSSLYHGLMT